MQEIKLSFPGAPPAGRLLVVHEVLSSLVKVLEEMLVIAVVMSIYKD